MLEEVLTSATIRETEDQHGAGTYYKRPIVIVRGQGAHLGMSQAENILTVSAGREPQTLDTKIPTSTKPFRNSPKS